MLDQPRATALATFVLRVALATMFLAHSIILKWLTFGMPGTAAYFVSVGLPGWMAYPTFAAEVIGGTLLLLGVHTRIVALALVPILIGAAAVHVPHGWLFEAPGGGWEYPAYLALLAVVQALLGDGAYALRPSAGVKLGGLDLAVVR